MNGLTTLRIDLGIDAQQIASQVMINNKAIESQITEGIELALNDILEEKNFVNIVREQTKEEVFRMINQAIVSYDVRYKIQKAVAEKIEQKIGEFADEMANGIMEHISKKD